MLKPLVVIMTAAVLLAGPAASAKTFRWSTGGDFLTADPHSQNENFTNGLNAQVHEALVLRGKQLEIVPGLAVEWIQINPLTWRFKLRPGVKFHDGAPFTADDVVFSIERAQHQVSPFRVYANGLGTPKKVDDLTVELVTKAPNPVLLEQAATIYIMSKAWCIKNKVERPQNFKEKEETYTARNANGTGPYVLKGREPDVKTVMVKNPDWWGKNEGNVTEMIYLPIKSDATRVAALLSGELDFVLDPPPQDLARLKQNSQLKVVEGTENRVIFLGMDQHRDELLYSNVKGKNPFKDIRVRQALYHAIDIEAIRTKTMRGLALPTGSMAYGPVNAYGSEVEKRLPYDRARARQLLAEAGYPNGFEVTLDCPNNRYINDEQICQALSAMFAQVGVNTKLNTMPRALYFPKLDKLDTSLYMLGWGGAAIDASFILLPVLHSRQPNGDGTANYGNYKNGKLDELIDQAKVEMDAQKRTVILTEALLLHNSEVLHIPLHRQVIPWAMRSNVRAVHRANNVLELRWTEVN